MEQVPDPNESVEALERIEKLRLEKLVLTRQLSRQSNLLEWTKAIAGPVAVVGLLWTVLVSISQRRDAAETRLDERFERSIGRTGSAQLSERLIGVTELNQFLTSRNPDRQEACLQFLINAAVIEQDPTVRNAILDIFESLRTLGISPLLLKGALASARDRNRALLKRRTDSFWQSDVKGAVWPNGEGRDEIPIGKLSPEELAPLETTASIIAALVRAGATAPDLSQIYCVKCQFGLADRSVNLEGIKFDGAFLRDANFLNADLQDASFRNADLIRTHFTSANMRNAKITADIPATPWEEMAAIASNNLLSMWGADFGCADLTDADLSGRAIFTFIYSDPVIGAAQQDTFVLANLNRTKLTGFQILLGIPSELAAAKEPAMFSPQSLLPVYTYEWAGPSQPIGALNKKTYLLWSIATDRNFKFTGPIDPKTYWDLVLAFRQLHHARNLDKADMPLGLRTFLKANDALFSPVLGEPGCTPR